MLYIIKCRQSHDYHHHLNLFFAYLLLVLLLPLHYERHTKVLLLLPMVQTSRQTGSETNRFLLASFSIRLLRRSFFCSVQVDGHPAPDRLSARSPLIRPNPRYGTMERLPKSQEYRRQNKVNRLLLPPPFYLTIDPIIIIKSFTASAARPIHKKKRRKETLRAQEYPFCPLLFQVDGRGGQRHLFAVHYRYEVTSNGLLDNVGVPLYCST